MKRDRVCRLHVDDLFQGHLEWKLHSHLTQDDRGPGPGGDDQRADPMGPAADLELDLAVDLADGADRGTVHQRRTILQGEPAVRGIGPGGHGDA